ncbi:CPBP family intramembrane glutamic endopeptidase [Roseovarius sp. EL26]|uniref:CPBP family intramembrane glutamic endopeptidase n=1 Tax=Roseovarius sp. EL26 TaxID=2126672 RepID=UPI000EA31A66|nr:CPBP family intramembrane glutamic endopeptidase [Roseovarius sp. EL26]
MNHQLIQARRHALLWLEMIGIFVISPVIMAVFLPPNWLFSALFLLMLLGLWLLYRTPSFSYSDLYRGFSAINWAVIFGFFAATAVVCYAVVIYFAPHAAFGLARHNLPLLLMILLLYPVLSALPQEIVYRALFFERYKAILPSPGAAVVLNSALFALAHLMYWNIVVTLMTFCGSLLFAHSYAIGRNFPQAVLLHAIGGNLVFIFGLGIYFYSGNVTRPF